MNHAPTTPFQKFKQRAEAAGYNVEQIASGGYFIDGKTQDAWEGWKLCMDQQEADDGAEVERLAAQSAPTDEIRRYVIQQKTGEVPRLLGPCPNKRVVESLLRESYTAYPDCICIVVDMPVTAYPQHGREWLDMYGDKRKPRLAAPPAHGGDAPNPAQTGCAAGTEDECVRRDCAKGCPALQSRHASTVSDEGKPKLPLCQKCHGSGATDGDGEGNDKGTKYVCGSCLGSGIEMKPNEPYAGQIGWRLHRCPDGNDCRAAIGGGCALGWCEHFGVKAEERFYAAPTTAAHGRNAAPANQAQA